MTVANSYLFISKDIIKGYVYLTPSGVDGSHRAVGLSHNFCNQKYEKKDAKKRSQSSPREEPMR